MFSQQKHYLLKICMFIIPLCSICLTLIKVETGYSTEKLIYLYTTLGLFLLSLLYALQNKKQFNYSWLDLLVILWFIYISINFWFLPKNPACNQYLGYLTFLLFYILFRFCKSNFQTYGILVVLLLGGLYEALLGILQLLEILPPQHHIYLVTGSFFNPGPYSAYIAMVLSIASGYLCNNIFSKVSVQYSKTLSTRYILRKSIYIICIITFVLSIIILPATWSRSAIITYLFIVTLLLSKKNKKLLKRIVIPILLAIIALYIVKRESADGRILMMIISLHSFIEKPLFGHGIGSFLHSYASSQAAYFRENPISPFISVAGAPEYSFNELLSIGVEQGIIGIIFFVLICTYSLLIFYKKHCVLFYGWLALLGISCFSYPFSLYPFKILAAIFVASAANLAPTRFISSVRQQRISIPIISLSIIVILLSLPRITKKVQAFENWKLISNNQSTTFVNKYEEWYDYLSDNPYYLFEYAKSLQVLHRYNDSNAVLHRANLLSADPMFHILIGNNYKELKAYKEAEYHYLLAHYTIPNRLYPLYQLLILYDSIGDIENAYKLACHIVNSKPKIQSSATDDIQKYAKDYIEKTDNHH